jgi:hypothetical protein
MLINLHNKPLTALSASVRADRIAVGGRSGAR